MIFKVDIKSLEGDILEQTNTFVYILIRKLILIRSLTVTFLTQPVNCRCIYNYLRIAYVSKYLQYYCRYHILKILVKVIGGRQEGHPVQKCSLLQQSPN